MQTPKRSSQITIFSEISSRYALLIAAIFTSALFFLVFRYFYPHYDTNDDVFVTLFASGKFLNAHGPNEHLIYENVILGLILKSLYTYYPRISWYSFILYLGYFLAHTVTAYAFLINQPSRIKNALFLLIYSYFSLQILCRPQFTVAATFLVFSGLLLYTVSSLRGGDRKSKKIKTTIAFGCILLGGLIRNESFYLSLIFLLPFFALVLLTSNREKQIQFIKFLFIVILVTIAFAQLDVAYYKSSHSWGYYFDLHHAIGGFFNFYELRNEPKLLRSAGWTENDFDLFYRYFYLDINHFSLDSLIKLKNSLRTGLRIDPQLFSNAKNAFSVRTGSLLDTYYNCTPQILFFMVPGFLNADKGVKKLVAVSSAMGLILLITLCLSGRPALWRVFFPLEFFCVLFCFLRFPNDVPNTRTQFALFDTYHVKKFFSIVLLGTGILLGTTLIKNELAVADQVRQRTQAFRTWIDSLNPNSNKLFLAWGEYFIYEDYVLPFREFRDNDPLRLFSITLLGLRPDSRLWDNGARVDILSQLLENKNILLIAKPEWIEYLKIYYKEKRGLKVDFVKTSEFESYFGKIDVFRAGPVSKVDDSALTTHSIFK